MRNQVWMVLIALSLAAIVGAAAGVALLGVAPADARTASSSDDVVVLTGGATGGRPEIFYVVDSTADRLLAIELVQGGNQRTLRLGAVRDIRHDLQLNELPTGQKPSVKDVEEATKDDPAAPRGAVRKVLAATGAYLPGQNNLLWLYDTASRRIVTYHYTGKRLNVLGARRVEADLKLVEYAEEGTNLPVEEVRKKVKGRPAGGVKKNR
jgi:hypothetical protein